MDMRYRFILLAWILAIAAQVFGQTKEPYIYFENIDADFGAVRQGEILRQFGLQTVVPALWKYFG